MSKANEVLEMLEDTKKSRMYDKITKHGENLNKIFGLDEDPVALCKKLLRLENKMTRVNTDWINGDIEEDEQDKVEKQVLASLDKILGYKAKGIPVFVNTDPRGNALKIKDDWVRKNRDKYQIYSDMGGYGILAPKFEG